MESVTKNTSEMEMNEEGLPTKVEKKVSFSDELPRKNDENVDEDKINKNLEFENESIDDIPFTSTGIFTNTRRNSVNPNKDDSFDDISKDMMSSSTDSSPNETAPNSTIMPMDSNKDDSENVKNKNQINEIKTMSEGKESYMEIEVRRDKLRWLLLSEMGAKFGEERHSRDGFNKIFNDKVGQIEKSFFHFIYLWIKNYVLKL